MLDVGLPHVAVGGLKLPYPMVHVACSGTIANRLQDREAYLCAAQRAIIRNMAAWT